MTETKEEAESNYYLQPKYYKDNDILLKLLK